MTLIDRLMQVWSGLPYPFLIHRGKELYFAEIAAKSPIDLSAVRKGDVVALIGDFNYQSILTLLRLVDINAIVVPLTVETRTDHQYFFEAAFVDVIIEGDQLTRRNRQGTHDFLEKLRENNHAGLVLFSSGSTGHPKAILHDLTVFLKRFETPRPTLRTLNFLLFDHIGGLNTLFHTLFNKGVVIAPESRTVDSILQTCQRYEVELLPTTPTFLRMMLMSGVVPESVPKCLKVITYGTERMDQCTLNELCRLLPSVDVRQTYGMSELGILRIKSEARDSLYMKIGGEGVETRVVNDVLHIRSRSRMIGYLNAPSPFEADGWYDTKDVVDVKDGYYRIKGRMSDVINVAGLKFMSSDIERAVLEFPNVSLVKVFAKNNPITGQHVEIVVQAKAGMNLAESQLMEFLSKRLQSHMLPRRIRIENVAIGHRFKKS